ncbi:hypothetical protein [Adhaeretor mobilis]|uniref:hypothetical protein n=1 Tax=Adhaeretor mobilis TaxID=1930276 RepID=UPI0011A04900|nr:hypothetical protein [Adhaeretor mobilis]
MNESLTQYTTGKERRHNDAKKRIAELCKDFPQIALVTLLTFRYSATHTRQTFFLLKKTQLKQENHVEGLTGIIYT